MTKPDTMGKKLFLWGFLQELVILSPLPHKIILYANVNNVLT